MKKEGQYNAPGSVDDVFGFFHGIKEECLDKIKKLESYLKNAGATAELQQLLGAGHGFLNDLDLFLRVVNIVEGKAQSAKAYQPVSTPAEAVTAMKKLGINYAEELEVGNVYTKEELEQLGYEVHYMEGRLKIAVELGGEAKRYEILPKSGYNKYEVLKRTAQVSGEEAKEKDLDKEFKKKYGDDVMQPGDVFQSSELLDRSKTTGSSYDPEFLSEECIRMTRGGNMPGAPYQHLQDAFDALVKKDVNLNKKQIEKTKAILNKMGYSIK